MKKCHICGQDAILTCRQCGNSVCGNHFNYDTGKCKECSDKQYGMAVAVVTALAEMKAAPVPEMKKVTKRQKARK